MADKVVLGPGAIGDPENPELSRDEVDAEERRRKYGRKQHTESAPTEGDSE